jgi:hypothetical protein
MPRTALTVATPKGPHPGAVAPTGLDVTWQAADPTNGNSFPCSGRELLLMRNTDPANPSTVTVKSAPDPYGRAQDITAYAVAATKTAALKMTDATGWRQADGSVWLDIAGTGVIQFLVLRI